MFSRLKDIYEPLTMMARMQLHEPFCRTFLAPLNGYVLDAISAGEAPPPNSSNSATPGN